MSSAEEKVVIYGKDTWPYTSAAREAYAKQGRKVDYRNVKKDPKQMAEFLQLGGGGREVPLIVDAGKVTIGYGGSWGV